MGSLADIEHVIEIGASRDVVWQFLVEPEHVSRWLGCLRYEKQIGHVFYMQQDEQKRATDDIEGATHCRVTKLQAPELFAFAWYLPGTPETEVRIELTQRGSGATTVRLTHAGWDQFDDDMIRPIYEALLQGWGSFVLPQLKRTVEAGP